MLCRRLWALSALPGLGKPVDLTLEAAGSWPKRNCLTDSNRGFWVPAGQAALWSYPWQQVVGGGEEGTRRRISFLVPLFPSSRDGYICCSHSQRLHGPFQVELVGLPQEGWMLAPPIQFIMRVLVYGCPNEPLDIVSKDHLSFLFSLPHCLPLWGYLGSQNRWIEGLIPGHSCRSVSWPTCPQLHL